MKKIWILFLIILVFLSGCSMEYQRIISKSQYLILVTQYYELGYHYAKANLPIEDGKQTVLEIVNNYW
jgi:uncharacterized protein YcfL